MATLAGQGQGGELGWSMWLTLMVAAWTIIPIAARRANKQPAKSPS